MRMRSVRVRSREFPNHGLYKDYNVDPNFFALDVDGLIQHPTYDGLIKSYYAGAPQNPGFLIKQTKISVSRCPK